MSTNYPGALDTTTVLENNRANTTLTVNDHATQHNNISDAIIAVETELGTSPKGTYADVKTRLSDAVVKTPTAAQVVAPGGDYTGIAVKANVALATANVFEGQDSTGAIKYFVDKNFKVSAAGFLVNGTALQASDLSNGVSGTGAVVLATGLTSALAPYAPLASPALTGTPTAPTPAPGDNSTKLATTAFVAAATPAAGTSGTLAAIPAASSKSGLFYYATDQAVLYWSNGTSWTRMSIPAGTLVDWMNAVVPTGWVAYDGSTLAGSTGIYADLYAHLGNTTTLPDTRGRMTVAKGTHVDVATIGNSDLTPLANRRPKHQHTIYDPGHFHTVAIGDVAGTPYTDANYDHNPQSSYNTSTNTTGVKVNPEGAASSSSPQDTSPYIVTLKIAKL